MNLKRGEFIYCLSCPPSVGPVADDKRLLPTIQEALKHLKDNGKHRVVVLRDLRTILQERGEL